jgi:hypothetical protein
MPSERFVCRICGYQCGLVATGCSYVGVSSGIDKWAPGGITMYRSAPPRRRPNRAPAVAFPEVQEVTIDSLPQAPPRAFQPAPVSFVGAGPMHRRWR